ncbi:conserved hypothetical protein [Frankia canadensis]|uniref:GmrSD restriction endonucleases N-terminal domain-containing protein n=1 Tax=Frankia canadensis TaxID=1836972 RepID=A0A2I2KVB3_9ACTN|nr:DUF262 domain-containing protein [Frankia canadensis]SNQ49590.1 conserved hypothetical protein [Frankia canadensis]SOU56880.1 conserved hypothetical protein [Frankia canadensis]
MALEEQISIRAKEIHTDGYPMSIGEVLSLYRDGDIEIHPEFQRIFRWDGDQKSSLIESILLGIPIPPIFVSQRTDGVWDVIDGVQRLSTVLQFVGVYRDESGVISEPLTLSSTEYLPDLDGYRWEISGPGSRVFSDAMRRDFKRAKLEFRIIRKESDSNAKYDMFQRLNAGTRLSEQEARNCLLVMLNRAMYTEITRLSSTSDFRVVCQVSDQKENQAYYQELVLRFFCQADYGGGSSELPKEFGEYVTSWMRSAADAFGGPQSQVEPLVFDRTFHLLADSLGDDAMRRWDGRRHLGPFSIACFEFVTAGVCANIDLWESRSSTDLAARIRGIWSAPQFRDTSGTGVSPRRRFPRLVLRAREYFAS